MTLQNLAEIAIALAAIGLIMYRQLRWRAFDPARALRMPIVLGAIGVFSLARMKSAPLTSVDVTFMAAELALSLGVGAAMGRLTTFRTTPEGVLQTRSGWLGASLWFVLIAIRIGFDAVGASLGSHVLTQSGVILLMVAASRATAALVTRVREPGRAAVAA